MAYPFVKSGTCFAIQAQHRRLAQRVLEFIHRFGKKSAFHRVGYVLEKNRKRWGIDPRILGAFRAAVRDRSVLGEQLFDVILSAA